MPVITCDPLSGVTGDQVFNPSCFALPSRGPERQLHHAGSARTGLHQPRFRRCSRTSCSTTRRKFQFRASFTNVFNHPQRFLDDNANLKLDFTNGVMTNTDFGVLPQNRKYGRRIVQLAFKFYF